MRQFLLTSAAALIIGAFCFQTARATVLTFDDLPANENPVQSGYGGFDWYNQTTVGSFDPAAYGFQNTGYDYGTVSRSNMFFN
jgi:hypothetical protein